MSYTEYHCLSMNNGTCNSNWYSVMPPPAISVTHTNTLPFSTWHRVPSVSLTQTHCHSLPGTECLWAPAPPTPPHSPPSGTGLDYVRPSHALGHLFSVTLSYLQGRAQSLSTCPSHVTQQPLGLNLWGAALRADIKPSHRVTLFSFTFCCQ